MFSSRIPLQRFLLPLVLAVLGILMASYIIPAERIAVKQQLVGFPDSDILTHQARPLILGVIFLLPALGTLLYAISDTMDRYLVRQFGGIFGVCFSALISIWLLFDLNDNISEFRDSENTLLTIATFYTYRIPAILLFLMPYALLLSLLYCFGKLSSDREIVAMIQSGRGVGRITRPLIITGVFFSLLCMGLNYQWAPIAEGRKDNILNAARGRPVYEANNVMFREPHTHRLWMVGIFPKNFEKGEPLQSVEVTTTDEKQSITQRITASSATWKRKERLWIFENANVCTYSKDGVPTFKKHAGPLHLIGWSETPLQLIKPGLSAEYLGIPGLVTWLKSRATLGFAVNAAPYLTHLHYRIALPFACLVTILLATPLSIHFSRRGPGGGVFLAVVLSALMLLISNIALAFGESGYIPPYLAAWLPNIIFSLVGLYLYHRRATGRPIYQSLLRLFPSNGN
ncbi:MAG: LptF/LptG family permease [Luteolibacter sp.]